MLISSQGGKSPAVIFEDANLENALEWTIKAIMARSGQVCIAASRVYVQKSIADEFITKYVQKMREAVNNMGDPEDPNVAYGPLVDKISFDRVKGMIERAKGEAELVVGGSSIGETGCFVEAAVFVNPKPAAEILTDEVFGPVSVVTAFETEDEVLAKANDTEFGLMSGVFTRDITRALRVSSKLESGCVFSSTCHQTSSNTSKWPTMIRRRGRALPMVVHTSSMPKKKLLPREALTT